MYKLQSPSLNEKENKDLIHWNWVEEMLAPAASIGTNEGFAHLLRGEDFG